MMAPLELLARAKALHQAGELREAERVYTGLLERDPGDVECLNLLGLIHADTGRTDTSIQLLRVAIGIAGPEPWLCRNLGIVLERTGDLAGAVACFRQAVEGAPKDHEIWGALGGLLTRLDRIEESISSWMQALENAPPDDAATAKYRLALANAMALLGDGGAAIPHYDLVLRSDPENIEATFHRAVACMQESDIESAINGFRQTLELDPRHARASNNLGVLYQLKQDYRRAIESYGRSVRLDPMYHAALYNLGTAWLDSANPKEAIGVFRKLLKTQPNHVAAWTNLGNARLARNETDAAVDSYNSALEIDPDNATASWNLGIVRLLTGNFLQGWAGYEQRFEVQNAPGRGAFRTPLWHGESLAGKRLLLHAEQGLGDTLQFVRYASVFTEQGARVTVECQPSLLTLLTSSTVAADWIAAPKVEPGSTVVAGVDHLPEADYQLPMMSAPHRAYTTIESIPFPSGYLRAPSEAIQRWRTWLGSQTSALRTGICWAGNPNHKNDRNRSIPPELLCELEAANGVEWVNLQKGNPIPPSLKMRNAAAELEDFADTAGLIENLDLVVAVDTSVAHLAGALGKTVWILLPFAPDWRWLLERSDSPWYSSARLFRQRDTGKWRPLLKKVAEELSALAADKRRRINGAILDTCPISKSK